MPGGAPGSNSTPVWPEAPATERWRPSWLEQDLGKLKLGLSVCLRRSSLHDLPVPHADDAVGIPDGTWLKALEDFCTLHILQFASGTKTMCDDKCRSTGHDCVQCVLPQAAGSSNHCIAKPLVQCLHSPLSFCIESARRLQFHCSTCSMLRPERKAPSFVEHQNLRLQDNCPRNA